MPLGDVIGQTPDFSSGVAFYSNPFPKPHYALDIPDVIQGSNIGLTIS